MAELKKNKKVDGKKKAAILLVTIGSKASSTILKEMTDEEVEAITREIALLDNIDGETIDYVKGEFRQMVLAQQYIAVGGIEFAKEVLEEALGSQKALEIIKKVQRSMEIRGFNVLKKLDTEQLLSFMQKEHPQTIALVLTQLEPAQASSIIGNLPVDMRNDVMYRFATMDRVAVDYIKEVEKVLESRVEFNVSGNQIGGVKMAAGILNMTGQSVEKNILADLSQRDPELATEIKNLMFVFEDILMLDDRSIQRVLKDVDMKELSLALKGSSEEMQKKILTNVSERAAAMISEEMEFMGPVKLRDVEKAQQKIVDIVRKLDEEGEVVMASSGGGEEIVV
ncbi:flagellar motor switch protein FliG [bacterium]|nr:flagellar motor switch protein FliG [bacterium]